MSLWQICWQVEAFKVAENLWIIVWISFFVFLPTDLFSKKGISIQFKSYYYLLHLSEEPRLFQKGQTLLMFKQINEKITF